MSEQFQMTRLIGIAGPARAGKDTLAGYACGNLLYQHYWFAKPLKEAARHMFGLSDRQLYGDLKEVKDKRWRKSPREILQILGTEVARDMFHKNLWIMRAEQEFIKCDRRGMIISDVRYENEAKWIRKMGGIVVHVKRANAKKVRKHASEDGIKLHKDDIIIQNNGTITQLYKEIGIWIFGNSYIGGLPRDARPTR